MEKFEHKLRTTIHTRSVEQIMTRSHAVFPRGREFKLSQPKIDNISTYLRKFEIDRENLNLAKRIMECQSEHSRNKYVKEWKKVKKFMRVRSNFKPQLSAQEPKIYKFQGIPGRGKLFVKIVFSSIASHMRQINSNSLYLLKFILGGIHLVPNKQFVTLETSTGYTCSFFAPLTFKSKVVTVKLIKVVENNMFQAGKFTIHLDDLSQQTSHIISKAYKVIGEACFTLSTALPDKSDPLMLGQCQQTVDQTGEDGEDKQRGSDSANEGRLPPQRQQNKQNREKAIHSSKQIKSK